MILIDAFVIIDNDLYHVSGPIDTDDPDWLGIAQNAGRVTLSLESCVGEDDARFADILRRMPKEEVDISIQPYIQQL